MTDPNERLRRILAWRDAYPENMFRKPTDAEYEFARRELGELLTLIIVDAMRHVATRMAEIVEGEDR